MFVWLIEYADARQQAVYLADMHCTCCSGRNSRHYITTNPWDARRFETREVAEAWMDENQVVAPWFVREHGFDTGYEVK